MSVDFLTCLLVRIRAWHQLFNLAEETDRVLVLVQLNGENDGLNNPDSLDQYSKLTQVRPPP